MALRARLDQAYNTALEYKGAVLSLPLDMKDGPWSTLPLGGRYTEGPWQGWIEDAAHTWILFVDNQGLGLLWTKREADGGVIGQPYAANRYDLSRRADSVKRVDRHEGEPGAKNALRYDVGTTAKPEKLASGWLRVDADLTRTGIFAYRTPNGGEVREFRSAAEVFHADSLRSFSLVPVTNDHPPELLTAANSRQYTVGTVGEKVERAGDHVRASIMITDAATVADVEGGKAELSCGYVCDIDPTPGVFEGQRYDVAQVKIRGNHVAIVDRGRAGDAKLRLDSDDAAMVSRVDSQRENRMRKIMIKGVLVEVEDSTAALIEAEHKDHTDALTAKTREVEIQTARADAATDKATKAETLRLDAADPVKFVARVSSRVALEVTSRAVLGSVIKLDDKDDQSVQKLVLAKLTPAVKLDGKSADYITARYDIAIEEFEKNNPALNAARAAAHGDPAVVHEDADDPEVAARARMIKANSELSNPKK